MRISFCGGKKAKIRHNKREFISANVDKSRVKNNIIIVNETVQEAYGKVFGEAQQNYNAKQKRKDRKIGDYYTHLFGNVPESKQDEIQTNKNNQHSFYEYIVQIGDKDSAGILINPKNAQIVTECLQEYIENFQERNPNLHMFNAIIHLDEYTPHLHLDFIPFAEGYKKGMERQLSINKAFEAMGYDKNCDNAIRDFNANERKIIREICEQHGLEIEKEEKSREITFTPQQMREGISELYSELTETEKNLQEKQSALQTTQKELQEKQSTLSEVTATVQTAKATVNALREQEQELQKKVDEAVDLVKNFTPSPTKIVKKKFGKEKEETKTDDELKTEKMILTAQELLAQREKIFLQANEKARLVVSSAETTAQEIISKAENSEIVLTAKSEAKKIIQKAESTKESADNYFTERIALADEEAEERSRQLDEREAHINALAELSKPTAEYTERMEWLYDIPVRPVEEEFEEEIDEPEEEFDFEEDEIEEPDYYDGYGY